MKDFITKTVSYLTDNPQDVIVSESESEGVTLYSISVNKADMGKVIGKSGRIVKALRDLVRIKAIKAGLKVSLSVSESAEQIV